MGWDHEVFQHPKDGLQGGPPLVINGGITPAHKTSDHRGLWSQNAWKSWPTIGTLVGFIRFQATNHNPDWCKHRISMTPCIVVKYPYNVSFLMASTSYYQQCCQAIHQVLLQTLLDDSSQSALTAQACSKPGLLVGNLISISCYKPWNWTSVPPFCMAYKSPKWLVKNPYP